jgi:hypothetical protein
MMITNIRSGGGDRKSIIFGELRTDNEEFCMSGTIEDIINKIKELGGPELADEYYEKLGVD